MLDVSDGAAASKRVLLAKRYNAWCVMSMMHDAQTRVRDTFMIYQDHSATHNATKLYIISKKKLQYKLLPLGYVLVLVEQY